MRIPTPRAWWEASPAMDRALELFPAISAMVAVIWCVDSAMAERLPAAWAMYSATPVALVLSSWEAPAACCAWADPAAAPPASWAETARRSAAAPVRVRVLVRRWPTISWMEATNLLK